MPLTVFHSLFLVVIQGILDFLKTWWWVIVPGILYFPARALYKYWLTWNIWYPSNKWTMLEIIPPSQIERPFKAMEMFFHSTWSIVDQPSWREEWCEGEPQNGPFWFSVEIVSKEGNVHFYLRIPKGAKGLFSSYLQTHYPQTEIKVVQDYAQGVDKKLPNEKKDIYGEEFRFAREDFYPIRTYPFFEIQPGETGGEKKIEPFVNFLEGMAQLGPGEEFWFQMILTPITNEDIPWKDQGKEKVNELAKRPQKQKPESFLKTLLKEVGSWIGTGTQVLVGGSPTAGKESEKVPPPSIEWTEAMLTPGEREIIQAIENKINKQGFKTCLRSIYIYQKDKYVSEHSKIARSYMQYFNTQNLNQIGIGGMTTRTKVHYLFRKRRLYARKKAILKRYVRRFPPYFPKRQGRGLPILNAEELASIFHFPSNLSALPPGIPRISVKKGGAPPHLPTA